MIQPTPLSRKSAVGGQLVEHRWGQLTQRSDVESLTVGEMLDRSARLVPDKVALIYDDKRITFREIDARANALAAALQSLGVAKGDRVTVCLQNVPELVYSYYGISRLSAITAWSNPAYRLEEFEFILKNSGAKVAIMHRELKGFDYLEMMRGIRDRIPDLKHIVMLDPRPEDDVIDFRHLLDHFAAAPFQKPAIDPRKDYVLFYNTGGTTGIPKAAAHTHYTSIMRATVNIDHLNITADDVTIAQLPMFHPLGGATALVLPIATQGTVVMLPEFNVERSLQLIEEHRVTLYHCAPAHILMSTQSPNFNRYDMSSLRTGLAGGFTWPPEVFQRAYDVSIWSIIGEWRRSLALAFCAPLRRTASAAIRRLASLSRARRLSRIPSQVTCCQRASLVSLSIAARSSKSIGTIPWKPLDPSTPTAGSTQATLWLRMRKASSK
jgi:acyl-CoA synthetase (AMP-forming)/AMP-acid ligase II